MNLSTKVCILLAAILMISRGSALTIAPLKKASVHNAKENYNHHNNHRGHNRVIGSIGENNIEQDIIEGIIEAQSVLKQSIVGAEVAKRADEPMPTMSSDEGDDGGMPTISDPASYTYDVQVPNSTDQSVEDPYIGVSRFPTNFVFIVIGGIVLFTLICILTFYVITLLKSRHMAKSEKEIYFADPNGSFLGSDWSQIGLNSSNASLLEKSSVGSMNSISGLAQRNSAIFGSTPNLQPLSTSDEPRGYKDRVTGNRGSMFISPMRELMSNPEVSISELTLPMYNNSGISGTSRSLFDQLNDASMESSIFDVGASSERLAMTDDNSQRQLKRPPSQYLEDLINGDTEK